MNAKRNGVGLAMALMVVVLASPCVSAASQHRPGAAPPRLSLAAYSPESIRFPLPLRYSLERPGTVSLTICDADGWQVRSIVDPAIESGEHVAIWDGLDDQGHRVRGHAYLAVLRVDGRVVSQPFVLGPGCWNAERAANAAMAAATQP